VASVCVVYVCMPVCMKFDTLTLTLTLLGDASCMDGEWQENLTFQKHFLDPVWTTLLNRFLVLVQSYFSFFSCFWTYGNMVHLAKAALIAKFRPVLSAPDNII
jgi:hypothetical protein